MKLPQFIIGILLIIPGAFMIADSILLMLGNNAIFFPGIQKNLNLSLVLPSSFWALQILIVNNNYPILIDFLRFICLNKI